MMISSACGSRVLPWRPHFLQVTGVYVLPDDSWLLLLPRRTLSAVGETCGRWASALTERMNRGV